MNRVLDCLAMLWKVTPRTGRVLKTNGRRFGDPGALSGYSQVGKPSSMVCLQHILSIDSIQLISHRTILG